MSQAPPPHAQKTPTSTMAVIGLVLTLLCMPVFGFILSLIALIRINKSNGALGGQVLAIVGMVLAVPMCGVGSAVAIPSFVKFQCRSKQSEAKANLRALFVGEEQFKGDHGSYSRDFAAVGFDPHSLRFTYVVTAATATSFSAEANGTGDMAGDRWVIDQTGVPNNVESKCR